MLLLISLMSLTACKKSTSEGTFTDRFSGIYIVQFENNTIEGYHDSIGYQIVDSTFYTQDTIVISKIASTDSFTISQIPFEHDYRKVVGYLQNDSLIINDDRSNLSFASYIKGTVYLDKDSIRFDYRWKHMDTWSTGVLPNYGVVTGSGLH